MGPLPVLLMVSWRAGLLKPMGTEPKFKRPGVAASWAVGRPVPESPATTRAVEAEEDRMEIEPTRVPGREGEKVAESAQDAAGAIWVPQVFWVREKSPATPNVSPE